MSSRSAALSCALLLLTGCGHHSDDHGHSGHEADHGNGSELKLRLDDDKKWQVDEHTRMIAARIIEGLDSSAAIDSIEDARSLAATLDEELDVLVKGCTMTGAAHDQLHLFLVALFPKVEALKEEADVESLRSVRAEIGALFEEYRKHFE